MLDVSIIIVNYNTCEITKQCIDSIFLKTRNITFEVILVDNASKDSSKNTFSKDKRIIYIYNDDNLGFGLANNIGVKKSRGRNILFLNSDTVLINNAVKILSDFLDNNLSVSVCGGNLYDEKMNLIHSYRMFFPSIFWEINNISNNLLEQLIWGKNAQVNHTKKPMKVAYITGADLMIKRSCLDIIGLFSEKFFMYYEETELQYRIKKYKYGIYSLPYAKIQHLEGKSFGIKKYNINRILVVDKSRHIFYRLCYSLLYSFLSDLLLIINVFVRYLLLFLIADKRNEYHKKRMLNLFKLMFSK